MAVLAFGAAAGCCGLPAVALELDPKARVKAVAEGASLAPPKLIPELVAGLDANGREFSGACSATSQSVCYDNRNGRIVYRGSRAWMPEFSGLRAEHISVRRDKVQFHYSFK